MISLISTANQLWLDDDDDDDDYNNDNNNNDIDKFANVKNWECRLEDVAICFTVGIKYMCLLKVLNGRLFSDFVAKICR